MVNLSVLSSEIKFAKKFINLLTSLEYNKQNLLVNKMYNPKPVQT